MDDGTVIKLKITIADDVSSPNPSSCMQILW